MTPWEKRLAWVFVALLALATAAAAGSAPRVADPLLALGDDADPLAEDDLSCLWPSFGPAVPGLQTSVSRTPDQVVPTFRVPGADKGSLAVKTTAEGVFVSFSSVETRKSAAGKARESRAYAQFVGRPADADPAGPKVERRGDAVTVTYRRRAPGPRS